MEGPVDTFANRLNTAMRIRNVKASELSEKTGISKSSLSEYMKGKYEAKQTGIYLLSKVLNVSEAWLMGLNVPMERNLKTDRLGNVVVPIPLLGVVKAGYDYMAEENWQGTIDLDKTVADTGEFFALKVKGDSMSPIFLPDDIVILRKQNDCENNEIAVVVTNGNEGTLKRVKKYDNEIILEPLNPAYPSMRFTNEEIKNKPVLIVGVFEQLRRDKIKI